AGRAADYCLRPDPPSTDYRISLGILPVGRGPHGADQRRPTAGRRSGRSGTVGRDRDAQRLAETAGPPRRRGGATRALPGRGLAPPGGSLIVSPGAREAIGCRLFGDPVLS